MVFTLIFYLAAGVGLTISFIADRRKTVLSLQKAWNAFSGILPEFLMIIIATGLILAFVTPELIASIAGEDSGVTGVLLSSIAGSVTLMPGFVAFPMASLLFEKGAGILQIGAFVSSLMMVGVVTFSMERKTFGTRIALWRNSLAWLFSLAVAGVLAVMLGGVQ